MSLTMHQATVPAIVKVLNNLSDILDKAASDLETRKVDQSVLMGTRLTPDMFPFARQFFLMCYQADNAIARLAGIEAPSSTQEDANFADLKARMARSIAFAQSVTPSRIDGSEDREIVIKLRDKELKFSGRDYLFHFFIPNFYFHATTAYNILRQSGVPLGKMDFLRIM